MDRHAAPRGGLDQRRLVEPGRQVGDEVQPRGDARRLEAGQLGAQGGEQGVAPPPVDGAHAPQVAVELAAVEEVGERELVEHRRAAIGEQLGLGDALDELRREDEPAEPEPGRERLAGGAGVDHAVGSEALQRADRRAVVAVLGVVVVLDDQRVALARPAARRRRATGPTARRRSATGATA